jgi:hypothetical protein
MDLVSHLPRSVNMLTETWGVVRYVTEPTRPSESWNPDSTKLMAARKRVQKQNVYLLTQRLL